MLTQRFSQKLQVRGAGVFMKTRRRDAGRRRLPLFGSARSSVPAAVVDRAQRRRTGVITVRTCRVEAGARFFEDLGRVRESCHEEVVGGWRAGDVPPPGSSRRPVV